MIAMIDNFDSFTWNLVQYLYQLGCAVEVYRNNAITPEELEARRPSHIVISPGPGRPEHAGVSLEVIRRFAPSVPLLGVCLGHQCIGRVYGGEIIQAARIMHGKLSRIRHRSDGVFRGLPDGFQATRYHSLAIDRKTVPDTLNVNAESEDGEIMGVRHREYPLHGVQFHPESILSDHGPALLKNFLDNP
jgi:anthranilate synthase component 2